MAFLSVIIPVYNVEEYLAECIDSVLRQNLTDYEILLVDDGSPDNSGRICDEYAENYKEIKVIHKENGGSSSARNAGIESANGDYIIFMDSDDWWNNKVSVTEMLKKVKSNPETEMFLFTSLDYIEDIGFFKRNEHKNIDKISVNSVQNYYSDLLKNGNLEVAAYNKILKREFIIDNSLFFKQGITCEDNEWMLRLLRVLKNVKVINEELYIYRSGRKGSITNMIGFKNVKDLLEIVASSIDFYKINKNHPLKELEFCFCSYLWFSALGLCVKLSKNEKNSLKEMFFKTKVVCDYSNSPKTVICNKFYKILGFNLTAFILGKYIKIKSKKNLNKTFVKQGD